MNFNIFKTKQKTPHDLVKHIKDAIYKLDGPDKRKAAEEVSKYLVSMKNILYGEDDHDPSPDLVAQLAQEVYRADLLQLLVLNIQKFEFEIDIYIYIYIYIYNNVAQIFNNLLRRQIGSRWPTVEHICAREEILFNLLRG
ncbi:protein Mo25 [Rhizopus microsporus]|uniref:Protein Mo25 n=1 Tax=Rhizopus microsporus TaxID=58291 RepID=A0A1X0RTS1_RHIZD|nr:protein Mo25 [Rhizopus microsporus]